jgi:spore germination cell wall hydrolase CwlJ-like protein
MKKMRISAFVVFIIGMVAIIIHMLTLNTSSKMEPKDVTAPKEDKLSTEITNTPDNDYPVAQLVNNESNFNYSVNKSKSESEIDDIIEPFILLTEEEKRDFSALVYLEAGGESYECMKTVASVIVNRMINNDLSLYDVIYATNQFEPAENIPYTDPSEEAIQAVNEIVQNGPCVPKNVTFFRASYYHNWSDLIQPYTVIDNTYFSYDVRIEVD